MLIISPESDQYQGVQNEKSKLPLKHMTGYYVIEYQDSEWMICIVHNT